MPRDISEHDLEEIRKIALAHRAGVPGTEIALHDALVEAGRPCTAAWHFQIADCKAGKPCPLVDRLIKLDFPTNFSEEMACNWLANLKARPRT